jgi:hypothetical protein
MRTELRQERYGDYVVLWRRDQLVDAGFPPALAVQIGQEPRYDLHALIELVERGCPPELAARILVPLDGEGDA